MIKGSTVRKLNSWEHRGKKTPNRKRRKTIHNQPISNEQSYNATVQANPCSNRKPQTVNRSLNTGPVEEQPPPKKIHSPHGRNTSHQ